MRHFFTFSEAFQLSFLPSAIRMSESVLASLLEFVKNIVLGVPALQFTINLMCSLTPIKENQVMDHHSPNRSKGRINSRHVSLLFQCRRRRCTYSRLTTSKKESCHGRMLLSSTSSTRRSWRRRGSRRKVFWKQGMVS